MKTNIILFATLSLLLLSACGEKLPEISHMLVKSSKDGVLLDTSTRSELKILGKIFHEKIARPDAAPEFRYLIDITQDGTTIRWQYSINGYIRNYEKTNDMIYLLKEVALFNRTANISKD